METATYEGFLRGLYSAFSPKLELCDAIGPLVLPALAASFYWTYHVTCKCNKKCFHFSFAKLTKIPPQVFFAIYMGVCLFVLFIVSIRCFYYLKFLFAKFHGQMDIV